MLGAWLHMALIGYQHGTVDAVASAAEPSEVA
jgi:hypothetical protein